MNRRIFKGIAGSLSFLTLLTHQPGRGLEAYRIWFSKLYNRITQGNLKILMSELLVWALGVVKVPQVIIMCVYLGLGELLELKICAPLIQEATVGGSKISFH